MNADEPGQVPNGAEDARLNSLEERLKAAHDAEAVRTGNKHKKPSRGYSQGNRVLAELIAGIAGGALIGWLIDRWLESGPVALLVSMFLGIAVAFRNIIRISNERPE
jgi:ATP synthase protein I